MKRIYTQAFNELKKLGVPVYEHADDDGNFSIDAESEIGTEWANYYAMNRRDWDGMDVNPAICEVLDKHRLFCEWVNPGRLAVYPA